MTQPFVPDLDDAVVRYQASDLDRSVAFYTEHLGFELAMRAGPVAIVSRGRLDLLLSGQRASGGRSMPDGAQQSPGGWNRIVLYVEQLEPVISRLEGARAHFRNQIEEGPGGRQILLDDPDGNPIELHEPPAKTSA